MTAGTICYALQGPVFVLKFSGDIRYTMGCSLDDFIKRLFSRNDFETVLIDLREAQSIDSTSLGLLAKISNFMRLKFHTKPSLLSTNNDINQVLDSMGFDEIFDICDCYENSMEVAEPLEITDASKQKMNKTLLEAHQNLCDMNDKNRTVFKNVVDALANPSPNPINSH